MPFPQVQLYRFLRPVWPEHRSLQTLLVRDHHVPLYLPVPRLFEDLYRWSQEGTNLTDFSDVELVAASDLMKMLVDSTCFAQKLLECTSSDPWWAWLLLVIMTALWLWYGGSKDLLRSWAFLMRLV